MSLNRDQIEQVEKYLKGKKALKFCYVCDARDQWDYPQMIQSDGYSHGQRQVGQGVISVVIECRNCGHQLLLSAVRVGLA
jgi:hypothetical protein